MNAEAIAEAAHEEGIFDGTGGSHELHHLLVLNEPIEVAVMGEDTRAARERDSFVRMEEYWGENSPVIEAQIIGAPYGERTAWAIIPEDEGIGFYDLAPSAFYGPDKPFYMQAAEVGGSYYDARDELGRYLHTGK